MFGLALAVCFVPSAFGKLCVATRKFHGGRKGFKCSEDREELKDCTIFRGDLIVNEENVDFPNLIEVQGNVTNHFGRSAFDCFRDLTTINLPNLNIVKGDINIEWSKLTTLEFPHLQSVQQELKLIGNETLETMNVPLLTITKRLEVFDNRNLKVLHLPQLCALTELNVQDNARLQTISMHNITNIGLIELRKNKKLKTIQLPQLNCKVTKLCSASNTKLETINMPNVISVATLVFKQNNGCTKLEFPRLSGEITKLSVAQNAKLQILYMPKVNSVGMMEVTQNEKLKLINMEELRTIVKSVRFVHFASTFIVFDDSIARQIQPWTTRQPPGRSPRTITHRPRVISQRDWIRSSFRIVLAPRPHSTPFAKHLK